MEKERRVCVAGWEEVKFGKVRAPTGEYHSLIDSCTPARPSVGRSVPTFNPDLLTHIHSFIANTVLTIRFIREYRIQPIGTLNFAI